MSMEQQFRSAVIGGFNKQDVLTYIENSVKSHTEELNQLREELERVRQAGEDALAAAKEEGRVALERAEAAENKVAELAPRAAQMEKSTAELEAKRSALAAAERELKELRAKVAELAPKAEAYEAVKEKTAGIELEAHQRAKLVMDEAKRNAEGVRLQTEQWMARVRVSYDRLRGDLATTMHHNAQELERSAKALAAIGQEFKDHDTAIQAVMDAQKNAPLNR